jgi:hypothetical protein
MNTLVVPQMPKITVSDGDEKGLVAAFSVSESNTYADEFERFLRNAGCIPITFFERSKDVFDHAVVLASRIPREKALEYVAEFQRNI